MKKKSRRKWLWILGIIFIGLVSVIYYGRGLMPNHIPDDGQYYKIVPNNKVSADIGIEIQMFDGFLTIPENYYLDYQESVTRFSSKERFGFDISIGKYSENLDITTDIGANYFKNYKLVEQTTSNDLVINIMKLKATLDINNAFFVVIIHNYSEYMSVANTDLSIHKNIVSSYKVMKKSEYLDKQHEKK